MRLLSLDAQNAPVWEEFGLDETPPYAILSHTWDTREVSFSDLVDGSGKKKAGWRKIVFCAEQAAHDGLRYFWVDTCCIDKWNKIEREKAVNSMFVWYRNAARCYVFLADVSAASVEEAREQSSWEASFRTTRWFKRGWTLQELLAPASVEFYSKEGQILGSKSTLEQLIHEITKIPVAALQGCSLDRYSTSDRMEWAVGRETTEPEDGVYCLLGLLGAQLPLTYGEGKDKVFSRLEDVLKVDKVPWIIPYSRNDRFVGRQAQLADIEGILFSGKETTKIAIVGEGGAGKSQLALELTYRIKEARKSCYIFWIDASNADSLSQAYVRIARHLDIANREDEEVDAQKLVHAKLNKKEVGEWLLVFDNADDIELKTDGGLTPWMVSLINSLPQSELGSIVFTTTNSGVVDMLAPRQAVELGSISSESGQKMIQRYLTHTIPPQEHEQVKLLLGELSSLPLAIVHAAAYINTTGTTIKEYRTLIRKTKEASTREDTEFDGILHGSTDDPINATWLISFEQLHSAHPTTVDHLCFMACVESKDVPLELLTGTSTDEINDTIRTLSAYALVTRRPAESALDIHRLVHRAIREWLKAHQLLGQWTQKAITRLDQVFPNHDHRNRHKWRRLLPHAQVALSDVLGVSHDAISAEVRAQSQQRKWPYKWLRTRMNKPEKFMGAVRRRFRKSGSIPQQARYGLRESDVHAFDNAAMSLITKCAMAMYSDGRWEEAEELEVQVLATRKAKLGPDHPNTLISMGNLAATYRNQGRWSEAEELEVQVMATRKAKLGPDHPDTLISMANLAVTYRSQGRWSEAEELEVQVMATCKAKLGPDHPNTLDNMANLAATYRSQGRWSEAEELEVQVMATHKAKLGLDHPETLNNMANLAATYRNQGRWSEAEELEVQVMATCKAKLGPDHPNTLVSMANLAATYRNQGRWSEAEELEVQVMATCKAKLGPDHPETLNSMANLAATYKNQGRWSEAEELKVQVMATCKAKLGPDHPNTLVSMGNLAATYRNQGRWSEAEELEVQVLATRKAKSGPDHPNTLVSMANLASTYWNQGRWSEAEELEVQVLATHKAKLGLDHPDTLNSMANLAATYRRQRRWSEAEELEVQVLATRKAKLGPDHPDTLNSMANLAETWRAQGRSQAAIKLMNECVRLREDKLGANHPYTLSSRQMLDEWQTENTRTGQFS